MTSRETEIDYYSLTSPGGSTHYTDWQGHSAGEETGFSTVALTKGSIGEGPGRQATLLGT